MLYLHRSVLPVSQARNTTEYRYMYVYCVGMEHQFIPKGREKRVYVYDYPDVFRGTTDCREPVHFTLAANLSNGQCPLLRHTCIVLAY